MPRKARGVVAGYAYHVLNRANRRSLLFATKADYAAFEATLREAVSRFAPRLLAYCLMPNHWHLVLWPLEGSADTLARMMGWLTMTHAARWHASHGTAGTGHVYQGRYKSFPVQADAHLLAVMRYVERNPLRAGLVSRAEAWPWSSARLRRPSSGPFGEGLLSGCPLPLPQDWLDQLNRPESSGVIERVRLSVRRGRPLGDSAWSLRVAAALGLDYTLRPRGRPPRVP
jgi:putative transposase